MRAIVAQLPDWFNLGAFVFDSVIGMRYTRDASELAGRSRGPVASEESPDSIERGAGRGCMQRLPGGVIRRIAPQKGYRGPLRKQPRP